MKKWKNKSFLISAGGVLLLSTPLFVSSNSQDSGSTSGMDFESYEGEVQRSVQETDVERELFETANYQEANNYVPHFISISEYSVASRQHPDHRSKFLIDSQNPTNNYLLNVNRQAKIEKIDASNVQRLDSTIKELFANKNGEYTLWRATFNQGVLHTGYSTKNDPNSNAYFIYMSDDMRMVPGSIFFRTIRHDFGKTEGRTFPYYNDLEFQSEKTTGPGSTWEYKKAINIIDEYGNLEEQSTNATGALGILKYDYKSARNTYNTNPDKTLYVNNDNNTDKLNALKQIHSELNDKAHLWNEGPKTQEHFTDLMESLTFLNEPKFNNAELNGPGGVKSFSQASVGSYLRLYPKSGLPKSSGGITDLNNQKVEVFFMTKLNNYSPFMNNVSRSGNGVRFNKKSYIGASAIITPNRPGNGDKKDVTKSHVLAFDKQDRTSFEVKITNKAVIPTRGLVTKATLDADSINSDFKLFYKSEDGSQDQTEREIGVVENVRKSGVTRSGIWVNKLLFSNTENNYDILKRVNKYFLKAKVKNADENVVWVPKIKTRSINQFTKEIVVDIDWTPELTRKGIFNLVVKPEIDKVRQNLITQQQTNGNLFNRSVNALYKEVFDVMEKAAKVRILEKSDADQLTKDNVENWLNQSVKIVNYRWTKESAENLTKIYSLLDESKADVEKMDSVNQLLTQKESEFNEIKQKSSQSSYDKSLLAQKIVQLHNFYNQNITEDKLDSFDKIDGFKQKNDEIDTFINRNTRTNPAGKIYDEPKGKAFATFSENVLFDNQKTSLTTPIEEKELNFSRHSMSDIKNYFFVKTNDLLLSFRDKLNSSKLTITKLNENSNFLDSQAKTLVTEMIAKIKNSNKLTNTLKTSLFGQLLSSQSSNFNNGEPVSEESVDWIQILENYQSVSQKLRDYEQKTDLARQAIQKYIDIRPKNKYKYSTDAPKNALDKKVNDLAKKLESYENTTTGFQGDGFQSDSAFDTEHVKVLDANILDDFSNIVSEVNSLIQALDGDRLDKETTRQDINSSRLGQEKKHELEVLLDSKNTQHEVDAIRHIDLPLAIFEADKTTKKYRLASDEKRTAFDNKFQELKTKADQAKTGNNFEEVKRLKNELDNLYNALDGDQNYQRVIDKVKGQSLPGSLNSVNNPETQTPYQADSQTFSSENQTKLEEYLNGSSLDSASFKNLESKLDEYIKNHLDKKAASVKINSAKNTDLYNFEKSEANKNSYDAALTEFSNLQKSQPAVTDLSSLESLNNKLSEKFNALKSAHDSLDGNRNKLVQYLNSMETLSEQEKADFKTQNIDNLEKLINVSKSQEVVSKIKEKVKEHFNSTIESKQNLSQGSKTKLKALLENNSITEVFDNGATKNDSVVSLTLKKADAIVEIESMQDLTSYQKEKFIKELLDKNDNNFESIKQNAKALNDKNKALKELIANQDKSSNKYKLASSTNSYDTLLQFLNDYINNTNDQSKDLDLTALNSKYDQLSQKWNELDGETNLATAKENIKALKEAKKLTENQNNSLNSQLDSAISKDNLDSIVKNATDFGNAYHDLKSKVAKAKELKETLLYKGETQDIMQQLDSELSSAEELLVELEKVDSVSSTNITAKKDLATTKASSLQTKIDALNGIYKNAQNKLSNKFEFIQDNEKTRLLSLVNQKAKTISQQDHDSYLNQAFTSSQNNVKAMINETNNPISEPEKRRLVALVNSATKVNLNPEESGNVDEQLKSVVTDLNETKAKFKEVKDLINKPDSPLNNAQKRTLLSDLNQTEKSNVADKKLQTQELINSMQSLKDYVEKLKTESLVDPKNNQDFADAIPSKKSEYDAALEQALEVLNLENGSSKNKTEVDALKQRLEQARESLDGNERLTKAKQEAKTDIEAYPENFKRKFADESNKMINNATNLVETQANKQKIDNVKDKFLSLSETVANDSTLKSQLQYTGADQSDKDAYEAELNKAKTLLSSNLTLDSLTNLTDQVSTLNEKINALNGEQKIKEKRTQALAELEKLNNLNNNQKSSITNQITNTIQNSDINDLISNAKELDAKMKLLNNEVNKYEKSTNPIQDKVDYTNSSSDHATEYDNAYKKGLSVSNQENGIAELSPQKVSELTEALKDAESALDGEERLAKSKQNALLEIEDMKNLTKTQKDKLKASINLESTNSNAKVENIMVNARELDRLMKDLNDILLQTNQIALSQNPDYQNAAPEDKENIKTKNDFANELINSVDSSDSISPKAVETARVELEEALTKLNGRQRTQEAQKEFKNSLENLRHVTPKQKEALQAELDKAETPEKIASLTTKAKELDDLMENVNQTVIDSEKVKKTTDYKNADLALRHNLLIQDQNLDKILNSDDLLNVEEIQKTNEALRKAINSLDGDERLKYEKSRAKKSISSAQNLNDNQKLKLIEKVENANSNKELDQLIELVNELDQKMKAVKDSFESKKDQNLSKDQIQNYQDASSDKKEMYGAVQNQVSELINNDPNIDLNSIKNLLDDYQNAFESLDGLQRRQVLLDQLQKEVNGSQEVLNTQDFANSSLKDQDKYKKAVNDIKTILNNSSDLVIEDLQNALDKVQNAKKIVQPSLEDALEILNELTNISDSDKKALTKELQENAQNHNLIYTINKATELDNKVQEFLDLVDSLDNLGSKEKAVIKALLKSTPSLNEGTVDTTKLSNILENAKDLNDKVSNFENELKKYISGNQKNISNVKSAFDEIKKNTLAAVDQYQKVVDYLEYLKKSQDLLKDLQDSDSSSKDYSKLVNDIKKHVSNQPENADLSLNVELNRIANNAVEQSQNTNAILNAWIELVHSIQIKDKTKYDQSLNVLIEKVSDKEVLVKIKELNLIEILSNKENTKDKIKNLTNIVQDPKTNELLKSTLKNLFPGVLPEGPIWPHILVASISAFFVAIGLWIRHKSKQI
ncbi:GA module-containing protein [Mycoplasma sp. Ms02]|uniref:GA module-containing protein n=1 Tax=Mycoplasma sp. Ms02 TaxID=353851 RepID=UPI001C8AC640|nr:GA module-containing protein [Mycoplasma sp. Ms02]QZE12240.1 GA module-containing protein [Mycoplasma sp. Ms02]